jgi:hypothetical protein
LPDGSSSRICRSPGPGHDLVAEAHAGVTNPLDPARDVIDDRMDPVPVLKSIASCTSLTV